MARPVREKPIARPPAVFRSWFGQVAAVSHVLHHAAERGNEEATEPRGRARV